MIRIRKERHNSKKAFTLIEIVLAMAIMIIVIPLVFAAFYLVQLSHAGVAVLNDAKDYAALNAMAIENVVINASAGSVSGAVDGSYSSSVYCSSGRLYFRNGGSAVPMFDYDQYKIASGEDKWDVDVLFTLSAGNQTLTYSVRLFDNSDPSATSPYYVLTSSVYLPNGNRNDSEKLESGSNAKCFNFTNPAV